MVAASIASKSIPHAHKPAPAGIRVNTIVPGVVYTPTMGMGEEDAIEIGKDLQLVGRAGWPHEIVSQAAFMLSDQLSFVAGATFDVDGVWQYKA
jgi:3alpha(or 20beta)-hydroxysteroid dehydrogenase